MLLLKQKIATLTTVLAKFGTILRNRDQRDETHLQQSKFLALGKKGPLLWVSKG
jgi:hypothetical protein